MVLRKGNILESGADVVLFTGNATLRKDGCLVMGRGAAKAVLEHYPNCNRAFGSLIAYHYRVTDGNGWYGVLIHPDRHSPILGVFQVKDAYWDTAKLSMIAASVDILKRLTETDWKHKRIALNFPGIGNGGLRREDVYPLLLRLPDNVEIYEL